MKKLLAKVKRTPKQQPHTRITNDTVAEHRERIIAGGKRFKYPIQYARHKLVFNAIIISVVALIGVLLIGWWQLYPQQNTSDFMYRVTKVIPLPVASVDGASVRYSDYLMKYSSAVHYLQQKEQTSLTSEDGKRQVNFIKQQAMQDAIADTYAAKLAEEKNISVSDVELESFLKSQRQSTDGEVSQQTYDAVILDYYNWTPSEYRYATRAKLLRQKVAYAVDSAAQSASATIAEKLQGNAADFRTVAEAYNDNAAAKVTYGASGFVPKSNQDGGLTAAASTLEKGAVSKAVKSTTGDGYYYIKLLDSNATQVSYEYIKIPLTQFDRQLASLSADDKIQKYITIPVVKNTSE